MEPKSVQFNALLTDRVRLQIVAALGVEKEAVDFTTLLETLGVTKGNLSSHMRKLEEARLVNVKKEFVDRKPRTTYELTKQGRAALKAHLESVEALLKAMK